MRFPTTFECRPTAPGLPVHSLPDELMIDWSGVPEGATASIFLPAADAASIQKQAAGLYGGQSLKLADTRTLIWPPTMPTGEASQFLASRGGGKRLKSTVSLHQKQRTTHSFARTFVTFNGLKVIDSLKSRLKGWPRRPSSHRDRSDDAIQGRAANEMACGTV
jgi:hypothetical protein